MRLTDKPLIALLDAFASPDPTPGGGSAAALCGALGASLLAMVAGLPKTKHGTPEERAALDAAREEILRSRNTLIDLIDRDAAAYDLVVAAYKRPKATEGEKAERTVAIQAALRVATEVPAETARVCQAVVRAAQPVAEHGSPSAASDIAVGLHLLGTGAQGALFNVETNIDGLKDPAVLNAITEALRADQRETRDAMLASYKAAGVIEMMMKTARRLGFEGHHLPGDPQPEP